MLSILILVYLISAVHASYLSSEQKYEGGKSLMSVIEAVANGILLRNRCVNFIVDKYYHQILNLDWNKRFSYVSVYMIVIRENDDFFPPKRRFHEVLRASKATDCSAYIILNTNGLQVSRMLRYVEKERLINTRGDLILLHDYRLFNSSTNYIWNRIVNVIFIRIYNSAKRRSGEQTIPKWFDLSTVPLPYQSEGDLELQYIDTWYRGRFRYKNEHYPDKSRNLLNQSLRVPIFPHIPAVSEKLKISREGNLVDNSVAFGIEIELIKILAKALNFWPMVYVPSNVDNEKWGTVGGNESFTGLFGEAVSGNTPFLLGDIHYTSNHLELFDLSEPYNTECLTFLTPESLNDNSWKILIMPFKMYMWLSVLTALFLGGLIFYQFAQTYKRTLHLYKEKITAKNISTLQVVKRHKNTMGSLLSLYPYTEFQNSILYTYGMLLSVSLPRLPNAWALRVFIGWWWLYSILVAVAYRASMTAILANPMSRVTIDTLSQLASSQIAVGGWSEEMKDFFLSSLDTDSQEVGNKFEVITQDNEAISRVAAGKFAYYENKYFLRHARAKRQKVEEAQKLNATKHHETVTINRNLHIMSECVIHMPISLGLDRNSPLKQRVDLVIRRVTETGLIQKWLSDTMEWTVNAERPQESSSAKGLINLRKLYGALLALGIGYVASFIALMGEIYYWKCIVQRHPTYDKYHLDLYYKLNE